MQPIYTQTVGSGGAKTITFNNIPQTFTDLKIVVSSRGSSNGTNLYSNGVIGRFNGDSSGSYSFTLLRNYLSTANSYNGGANNTSPSFGFGTSALATPNTFGNFEVYIANYTSTNAKSYISDSAPETNNGSVDSMNYLIAGLWRNSNPIASLQLVCEFGDFVQHSTFSLYGITKG